MNLYRIKMIILHHMSLYGERLCLYPVARGIVSSRGHWRVIEKCCLRSYLPISDINCRTPNATQVEIRYTITQELNHKVLPTQNALIQPLIQIIFFQTTSKKLFLRECKINKSHLRTMYGPSPALPSFKTHLPDQAIGNLSQ